MKKLLFDPGRALGRRRRRPLVLERRAGRSRSTYRTVAGPPRRPAGHDQRHRDARARGGGRRRRPGRRRDPRASATTRATRRRPISYGSPVEQGTVLARLDDTLLKARVDQAKAERRQGRGRRRAGRRSSSGRPSASSSGSQRLVARTGRSPPQEYDTASADAEAAEAGRRRSPRARWRWRRPTSRRRASTSATPRSVAGEGGDPRPPGEHRPDGRRQPERAEPVPDRQGPEPDGDLGLGQRDRHRLDPRRPDRPVHRRRLPRRDVPGEGRADPAERQHDPERRDLHRGRRRSTTPAASSCPT